MSGPHEVTCDSLYGSPAGIDVYRLLVPPPEDDVELVSLLALLPAAPEQRVAVLGSGTGRFVTPLLERGHEVVAIDRSTEMLQSLRTTVTRLGLGARCDYVEAEIADFVAAGSDELLLLPATNIATFDATERLDLLRRVVADSRRLWLSLPNGELPDRVTVADGVDLVAVDLGEDRVLSLVVDDRAVGRTSLYQSVRHDVDIAVFLDDLDLVQDELATAPHTVSTSTAGFALWLRMEPSDDH